MSQADPRVDASRSSLGHAPVGLPRLRPLLDRLFLGVFVVSWLAVVAAFVPAFAALPTPTLVFALGLGSLLGYLAADLVAGSVHWLADRYFAADTPILGPALIAPFRAHHDDPEEMARHDFFEVSGNNAISTAPVVWALALLPPPTDPGSALAVVFGASLTLSLFATNQLHAWAHAPRPHAVARALQRRGLVLTPARHARHHSGGHDRAYCVTSGWLNPLLDGLGLFGRLEALVDAFARRRRSAR